jgi:hypothetical protein
VFRNAERERGDINLNKSSKTRWMNENDVVEVELGVLFQISFAFPSLWFLLIIVVLLSPTRPFWRNDDDLTHFISKKVPAAAASNSCILSFSLAPISGVQLLKWAKKSWWGGRNEMKWWDFNETTRGNQQIAQVRRGDLLVYSILSTISPPLRSSWGAG